MTILNYETRISGTKRKGFKKYLILKCDHCESVFERDRLIKQLSSRSHHFCSTNCAQIAIFGKNGLAHLRLNLSKESKLRIQKTEQLFQKQRQCLSIDIMSQQKFCKQCLTSFGQKSPFQKHFKNQKFCSHACRNEWSATKTTWGNAKSSVLETRFGVIHCASSFEREFVLICDNEKRITNLSRSKLKIPYIDNAGVTRTYYPDFDIVVNNKKYLVEIKSTWTVKFANVNAKLVAAQLAGHNYHLLIGDIIKKEIKFDLSKILINS